MRNIRVAFSQCPLCRWYSLLYISLHLEGSKYTRKPYALVSEITKKSLQKESENLHVCPCLL